MDNMNELERVKWEEEDLKEAHNANVRRAENQMGRMFLVEEVCATFMFEDETVSHDLIRNKDVLVTKLLNPEGDSIRDFQTKIKSVGGAM